MNIEHERQIRLIDILYNLLIELENNLNKTKKIIETI